MSDLADRLDALANDATRAISFLPFELALSARRRRRLRVRAGLAAAACAATVALLVAIVPGHRYIVRVITGPPDTPSLTSPSGPSSPRNDVWSRIAAVARSTAIDFGDATPTSAAAVVTNLEAYEQATGGASAPGDATTQVYFVAMTGSFTCGPACFNVSNPTSGTVLSMALDMSSVAVKAVSLTDRPVRLDQLGTVHQLDLFQARAGNRTSALGQGPPSRGHAPG